MLEDLATLESRVGRVYKNRMETYCGDSFKQPRTSEKKSVTKIVIGGQTPVYF